MITRKFITTKSDQEGSFSLYTFIRRGRLNEDISTNSKASIVMVHGNSENSDSYLEIGIHHALNDLEVHLIDLKGQGLSSGEKNGHFKIQEHHNQLVSMLEQVDSKLPCFIQAHSMGCLCTATFLINNPDLKIAGVIVGSPFWGFGDGHKISTSRKLIVQFLASFLEELPINGPGSTHFLSHGMQYYIHECIGSSKK